MTAECGQRRGQTPRYAKRYPLGRRKTQGNAAQDRLRRFIYARMGTAEYR